MLLQLRIDGVTRELHEVRGQAQAFPTVCEVVSGIGHGMLSRQKRSVTPAGLLSVVHTTKWVLRAVLLRLERAAGP